MAVTATPPTVRPETVPSRAGAAAVTTALVLLVAALAVADITQGTAAVGPAEVLKALTPPARPRVAARGIPTRLPPTAPGVQVGAPPSPPRRP
ncbi:ABC transporter permease, partial [Streptomyces cellulosae]